MVAIRETTPVELRAGINRGWRLLILAFGEPRDSYGRVPQQIAEGVAELIYWGEKTGPRTDVLLGCQMTARALVFFYTNEPYEAVKAELIALAEQASLNLEIKDG